MTLPSMLVADDPRHGTVNGYGNLKCRCEPCKKAWADKQRLYMRQRNRTAFTDLDTPIHGKMSTYKRGCICDKCRAAYQQHEDDLLWLAEQNQRHECLNFAPSGLSFKKRAGFICNDCLDDFQQWLRNLVK